MENTGKQGLRIILTGPESTGKSALSQELSLRLGGRYIAEYARDYMLNLGRRYTYEDVVRIAEMQRQQMEDFRNSGEPLAFFDTYLIITKVWFEVVFKKEPQWMDEEIDKTKSALYLLCRPDIPWEPDPLRENGGKMRQVLFERYEEELIRHSLQYEYIEGIGTDRTNNAIARITGFLKTNEYS